MKDPFVGSRGMPRIYCDDPSHPQPVVVHPTALGGSSDTPGGQAGLLLGEHPEHLGLMRLAVEGGQEVFYRLQCRKCKRRGVQINLSKLLPIMEALVRAGEPAVPLSVIRRCYDGKR